VKILKERIEEISALIAEVANGNFDYQLEVSETGDELDAVISGVSMLGQELKNSTVSRDFMQSIYQGVVDMLLVLNTDFTIRNVNEALEELLGFQEEDLQGLPLTALVQPNENPNFFPRLKQLQEKGKCLNVELLFSTRQESLIPTSCSFSYLRDVNHQVDGILIIAKDITELKKTEQALKEAKEKAEAANEAKSNFLSSMSHEIRTPLNGIMGFTDLLMETELNSAQAQYINLIKTSGSTLTKLLHDILDLHRIEQDMISLELLPFNFRKTFTANLEPYKHLAEGKKLAFSYAFDESVPQMVLGDASRLNQVLVNLVSNAIKFTEQGSIHVHHQATQTDQADGTFVLTCTVTDTGIGIPADKQALIFESFTQSDQSTSRKYGGFGLGLAISKRLVKQMEGELGLISPLPNQDKGAAFWFSVRLKQINEIKEDVPKLKSNPAFRLRNDFRILLVDDNEINVVLMQTIFKSMGTSITTAESGQEALNLAQSQVFDLVFMDIQMPDMDGLEASRLLRKSGFQGVIIAFSANAYKEDFHKSLAAGMNDHLNKPFTRQDLIAILKKWAV
jgi:two-component system, sensor histidine kinase